MLRRPQQKEWLSAIGGGELQPLAGFQIEPVDATCDSGKRARVQRFLHRPQSVFAVRRLNQDQPVRIKPERAEAMPIRTAVIAQAVSREDEKELFPFPLTPQQRHQKGECRRRGASLRHDFMQRAAGKPALG
jgi:hypothetical protein